MKLNLNFMAGLLVFVASGAMAATQADELQPAENFADNDALFEFFGGQSELAQMDGFRPGRPDRPGRPYHPVRPDRPGRPDHPGHGQPPHHRPPHHPPPHYPPPHRPPPYYPPQRPPVYYYTCYAQDQYGQVFWAQDTFAQNAQYAAMYNCQRFSYGCYSTGCRLN